MLAFSKVAKKARKTCKRRQLPASAAPVAAAPRTVPAAERVPERQFRYLNHLLYTQDSHAAEAYLARHKELCSAEVYHRGYERLRVRWTDDPLPLICERLCARLGAAPEAVVFDLGAGSCRLAQLLAVRSTARVVSVDFNPPPCASRSLPPTRRSAAALLQLGGLCVRSTSNLYIFSDAVADAAVFCLSLMNTDWTASFNEGARLLKPAGALFVAEPVSRLNSFDAFPRRLAACGFELVATRELPLFVVWEFTKRPGAGAALCASDSSLLRPCRYGTGNI